MNDDLTELERLGRVDPPAPGVLDAAREVLWSAVAAEMLATAPPGATHATSDPAAAQRAEKATDKTTRRPRQPRREDPGAK